VNPDDLERAWRAESSQAPLDVDGGLLVEEVRRRDREFSAKLFWRDVREAGVAILLVPVWILMGVTLSPPWTWYLTVPVLAWVGVAMLADLRRHTWRGGETEGPLREGVERSLAEVRRQIRLLRNGFWGYLLPLGISIMAFLSHLAWQVRSGGWAAVAIPGVVFAGGAVVFWGVYQMNQDAIRKELEPRERELEGLLGRLGEESGGAG